MRKSSKYGKIALIKYLPIYYERKENKKSTNSEIPMTME